MKLVLFLRLEVRTLFQGGEGKAFKTHLCCSIFLLTEERHSSRNSAMWLVWEPHTAEWPDCRVAGEGVQCGAPCGWLGVTDRLKCVVLSVVV